MGKGYARSMKIDELLREKLDGYSRERKIAKLAAETGISQVTMSRFAKNMNMSFDKVIRVLDYLGIEASDPGIDTKIYKMVPKVAAKAGAGASLETSARVEAFYAFRRDWLSRNGIHADDAVLLDVIGNSMEPEIYEGDTLLVDRNDKELSEGKLYVVTLRDELLVKRVQKRLTSITLISKNPDYGDVTIEDTDIPQLYVHGRVRWVGREM